MKKYIITLSVALLASVSLVSAQVGVQNFAFSKDLSVGATGSEVSNLQTWLIANGYDIPALSSMLAVKGYFGAQTKVALMKYQNENGIPNTGYFGPITRERFNRGNSINAPVKVISPNGNELWPINSVQTIRWNTASYSDNSNITIRIQKNISGCFNSSPNSACLAVMDPEYTIATDVANTGSYSWKVGTYSQVAYGGSMNLDDNYIVMICKGSNKAVGSCDSSDNMFSITSDVVDSRAPVINGIDAPTTLSVNQTGTWAVRSTDPQNGTLSYSVDWGDVSYPHITCPVGYTCQPSAPAASIQQGSTFTHAYTTAGTFTVTFTVKNNTGITTRSTVTVHVSQSGANPISIISPNGGEIWQKGTTQNIRWNSPAYIRATYADIKLVGYQEPCPVSFVCMPLPNEEHVIARNISINQNSYNWQVGNVLDNTEFIHARYTIQICETGTNNCDSSNSPFTIIKNPLQPTLNVTSPNGGEVWQSNSVHQIAWTVTGTTNVNTKVDIFLEPVVVCPPHPYAADGPTYQCPPSYILDKNIPISTIYNWIVATDISNNPIPAGNYTVRACLAGSPMNCDSSNLSFRIASSLLQICPSSKFSDLMPVALPSYDSRPSSYYILNGERRELTEFDSVWVASNCSVPENVVY